MLAKQQSTWLIRRMVLPFQEMAFFWWLVEIPFLWSTELRADIFWRWEVSFNTSISLNLWSWWDIQE